MVVRWVQPRVVPKVITKDVLEVVTRMVPEMFPGQEVPKVVSRMQVKVFPELFSEVVSKKVPQVAPQDLLDPTPSMSSPPLPLPGQYCTEDVDECHLQPNACHNGGTCFNTQGGHTCVCVNGWTGESCSENIDDCATAVCFNGATCHDRVASFYCACPMGKTGEEGGGHP